MKKETYLELIENVIQNGKYKDNWQSLSGHKTPEWFSDSKFGIFIHFGVYSVPEFGNEWYPRTMYDKNHREYEHHIQAYGPQNEFGYKDFIPMFKAEKFNADEWIALFKNAGAKYIMPVAEHHDGFAMYDTELNRWNAKNMGPCRDIVGELKSACNKNDLIFCASSHRAEHYFFLNMGRTFDSDVNDEKCADFYGPAYYCPEWDSDTMHGTTADTYSLGPSEEYLEDWLVRTCEIIDKYRPCILYFDWWIHNRAFKPYLKKLAAYYYNRADEWKQEVTINYKHEAFPPNVATFDVERGALTDISPVPWQTDTAIGMHSWGYVADNEYKSANKIICDLIDIVSKNGNLLLNVGPKADGTVCPEEAKALLDIGSWLGKNGEGIYGTTFWKKFGEGDVNVNEGFFKDNTEMQYTSADFRFTYKNGFVYAFQMRPDGKDVTISAFAKRVQHDFLVKSVLLLSTGEELTFKRDKDAMRIRANESFVSDRPLCFKIEIE